MLQNTWPWQCKSYKRCSPKRILTAAVEKLAQFESALTVSFEWFAPQYLQTC